MVQKVRISFETDFEKRCVAWRKFGNIKNQKNEFLTNFDKRVYELGLKALELERHWGLKK